VRPALRAAAVAASLTLVALTALLTLLTVKRASLTYENGRHFDVVYSVVYDESAVTVYAVLALGCAAVSALLISVTVRLLKRH
jgi:hypothetical protein